MALRRVAGHAPGQVDGTKLDRDMSSAVPGDMLTDTNDDAAGTHHVEDSAAHGTELALLAEQVKVAAVPEQHEGPSVVLLSVKLEQVTLHTPDGVWPAHRAS